MFADASVAKRMADQHTLFPKDWLFGNQYYVIATPAVAALFCSAFHNSVFSMACASSLMFLLILADLWMELLSNSVETGVLDRPSDAGATILRERKSDFNYGFQVLYTMASYYACYLLVILLHLGIWVRFEKSDDGLSGSYRLALAANLALGIP